MKMDRLIRIYQKNLRKKETKAVVVTIQPQEQTNFWLELDERSPIISLRNEVSNASHQTT